MLTFEKYLSEKFWLQYIGTDDDSVEAESDWICELEPQDYFDYAEQWMEDYNEEVLKRFKKAVLK